MLGFWAVAAPGQSFTAMVRDAAASPGHQPVIATLDAMLARTAQGYPVYGAEATVQSISSATATNAELRAAFNHNATSQCPQNTWSALSPSQCGSLAPVTAVLHAAIASSGYGYGCGGYYTGTDHPWMTCKGSAIDTTNTPVVVRHGYYNPAADPEGFGWEKARNKHNLWIQAIIDTINMSLDITGGRSDTDYTVYHYNPDGYVDQTVTVVADNVDTEFDGKSTQDGQPVGVLTGYCTPGVGEPIEEQCPQWVDTGPDPL
jgi:hypothetical protein